jgi:cytochrome c-type biogenesis protein CcmE
MYSRRRKYAQFGIVIAIIVLGLGYLAYTGVQESKSYYVTLKELNTMGDSAYSKRLRVAGNVEAGSIQRQGTHLQFALREEGRLLPVVYNGTEAPPDTFKDDSQALAEGTYGRDGVFHANKLQAKCASKYAPKPGDSARAAMTEKAQAGPVNRAPSDSAVQTRSGSANLSQ